MNMSNDLKHIEQVLLENGSEEVIASHRKLVPGSNKVYGVKMPFLNTLATQYKQKGFDLVEELWNHNAFEAKMLAVKILGRIAKNDPERSLQLVEIFAKGIDNWAICDAIGMQALKPLVLTHRDKIFALAKKYNTSSDSWQRRLSLVLVEVYTRFPECHNEIKRMVTNLLNDEDYYVKKAVVWINANFKKGK